MWGTLNLECILNVVIIIKKEINQTEIILWE